MMTPGPAKLRQRGGQAAVELALVLPILVVLALGLYDLSRAIQASNIITNMSREGANLAARTSIPPGDIMNSIAATAQPLAMSSKGAVYLTQVTQVGGMPTIRTPRNVWRDVGGNPALQPRVTSDNVAAVLSPITLQDGDSVFIFEVVYTYDFLFSFVFKFGPGDPLSSQTLYSRTIL